jgi:hypothetical protein
MLMTSGSESHFSNLHMFAMKWTILGFFPSFLLNRPLLPCGVEGFLLVNLLDNW